MIYRKGIPVEALTTLRELSEELGGCKGLLAMHKVRQVQNFPKPVAVFGKQELYVKQELEAYYQSVIWKQADKYIKELGVSDLENIIKGA